MDITFPTHAEEGEAVFLLGGRFVEEVSCGECSALRGHRAGANFERRQRRVLLSPQPLEGRGRLVAGP